MKKILSLLVLVSSCLIASAQSEVMLQGFYWDSYSDTKWTKLEKQADELARYFDLIWVPNSGYCGDYNNMGYMPLYYFNQNSSFGTEAELRSMISTFKEKGLGTIADIVINHHNTNGWFSFPAETYNGVTYQLQSTDICKNDDGGSALEEATAKGVSLSANNDTGTDWDGCRDLDHQSANVNKIVKAYLSFLLDDIGYTGFRYDMVKGYSASYTAEYNTASKPAFSVGECWDGSGTIKNWIDGTKVNGVPTSSAFDFQFRYRVRDAINQNNWTNLAGNASDTGGYPLIYQEAYRPYAVTFVENHDTEKRANDNQDPIKADTLAANAYLLAMPGVPCVFLKHWLNAKGDIKRMIEARRLAGITNTSTYEQVASSQLYYAVKTTGTKGSLICVVGKTPTAYTAPTDYKLLCSGSDYRYYINSAAYADWDTTLARIEAEQKAAQEEKDNFKTYTATVYVKADFTPVYFYIWDSNNNTQLNGNWPGKQPSTTTIDGETWYYQSVDITDADYYFNIIFNQGNGKPQTDNIEGITSDKYYTATISGGKVQFTDVTNTVGVRNVKTDKMSDGRIYNLMGIEVKQPARGSIYIQNGKKFLAR
ncbi:MAG: starch-binding protein [Bacteroidaceae bacterium]|nr:starch-binding protein [Bacteroidaceae bacterium]